MERGTDMDGAVELLPNNIRRQMSSNEQISKWLERSHQQKVGSRVLIGAKFERVIITLMMLTLLGALIAWGIIAYDRMRVKSEQNQRELNQLKIEFEKYKQIKINQANNNIGIDEYSTKHEDESGDIDSFGRNEQITRTEKKSQEYTHRVAAKTTAIPKKTDGIKKLHEIQKSNIILRLSGNGQREVSQRDQALHSWVMKFKTGDIAFKSGKYILIERKGMYFISVQMFFGNNTSLLQKEGKNVVLDFAIVNKYDRIASTSVPITGCKSSCTSTISQIVFLKPKDFLSIQSSQQLTFNMFAEKTYFTIYRLS